MLAKLTFFPFHYRFRGLFELLAFSVIIIQYLLFFLLFFHKKGSSGIHGINRKGEREPHVRLNKGETILVLMGFTSSILNFLYKLFLCTDLKIFLASFVPFLVHFAPCMYCERSEGRELDKIRFIVFIKTFANVVFFHFFLAQFTTYCQRKQTREDLIKHWGSSTYTKLCCRIESKMEGK